MKVLRWRLIGLLAATTAFAGVLGPGGPAVAVPLPLLLAVSYPPAGTVANGGTLMEARLDDSIPRAHVRGVRFQASVPGGVFADVGGAAPAGLMDTYSGLWNTIDLEGGPYMIRAVATLGADPLPPIEISSDPVAIHVNEQPYAIAQPRLLGSAPGIFVIFDASRSMDADGDVVAWRWDFRDGMPPTQGEVVQRMFPGPGRYPYNLRATDNLGGHGTVHYDLILKEIAGEIVLTNVAIDYCVCDKMTVERTGPVDTGGPFGVPLWGFQEASSGIPPAQGGTLGPYNAGVAGDPPVALPDGDGPFSVKCRFQVIATIFGNPKLCREGQRAKLTIITAAGPFPDSGLIVSDPRYDPTLGPDDPYNPNDDPNIAERGDCPYDGEVWCQDRGYQGGGSRWGDGRDAGPPNFYKLYFHWTWPDKKITWLDAPGFKRITRSQFPHTFKAKFEARVENCKCTFEVIIKITAAGVVETNEVNKINCTP